MVNINNCQIIDPVNKADNRSIINGPFWGGKLTLNITNCKFDSSTALANTQFINVGGGDGPINLNIDHCTFNGVHSFVNIGGLVTCTLSYCYFGNAGWVPLELYPGVTDDATESMTVLYCTFTHSTSPYQILCPSVDSVGYPKLNIDHCDFPVFGSIIQIYGGTTATVNMTNSNVDANMSLSGSPLAVCTYSHINKYGNTIDGAWVNGGNNVAAPGITPTYNDPALDFRYAETALLTAGAGAGPIGSQLHWLVNGFTVPVTLSNFNVE
jgi:hypothetical protein